MTSASPAPQKRVATVAALNDAFRRSFVGGQIVLTSGVTALPSPDAMAIIVAVRRFNVFNADNDPYGEHDFGSLEHGGRRYFWKIDYYDRELTHGSRNPSDPAVTTRVLTIMRADEY